MKIALSIVLLMVAVFAINLAITDDCGAYNQYPCIQNSR